MRNGARWKLAAMAAMGLAIVGAGELAGQAATKAAPLNGTLLKPMTVSYAISSQGNAIGTVTSVLTQEGAVWVRKQTTEIPNGKYEQEDRLNVADLASLSMKVTAGMGPGVSLVLEGGHVKGSAPTPPSGEIKDIDVVAPAGTVLPGQQDIALMVLPMKVGEKPSLSTLALSTGTVESTEFAVAAEETVTVPAGTFAAYRLEVAGQQPAQIWVRKDLPHVTLKQQLIQMPVVIEAQSIK